MEKSSPLKLDFNNLEFDSSYSICNFDFVLHLFSSAVFRFYQTWIAGKISVKKHGKHN